MREIIFRGKAINRDIGYHRTSYKNGDWVYGLVTRIYDERFELPVEMTDINGVSGIEVDYKTIGQYTGSKDKNGKKIFEGDIVSERPPMNTIAYIGKVVWDEEMTLFRVVFDTPSNCCILGTYSRSYTVIGNIYDNPELLK